MPINNQITFRKGTSSQWTASNPVLASGEPGWDTTNGILKIGDGVNNWGALQPLNYRSSKGSFELTSSSGTFNVSGGYSIGSLDVFLNGVKLLLNTEYTANNGSSFTLTEEAPSGSIIEYIALNPGFAPAPEGIGGMLYLWANFR